MMLGLEVQRAIPTFGISKIRTVLEGKYMVRVANTGISTIIDYNGNIVEKINLSKSR